MAKLGLAVTSNAPLDVVVGGLGLGYTARSALNDPRVRSLRVVEALAPVIEWHRRRLVPLGEHLVGDQRCQFVHGDFFELAANGLAFGGDALSSFDAVLALSLLHLLEDRDLVLSRIHGWLKPGGVFVSSTAVLGERMRWFRFIGPIGHWLGLIPMVRIFSRAELEASITGAGFEILESWQPNKLTDFVIARRAA